MLNRNISDNSTATMSTMQTYECEDEDDVLIVDGPQPDMTLFINKFEQELHAVLHEDKPPKEEIGVSSPVVAAASGGVDVAAAADGDDEGGTMILPASVSHDEKDEVVGGKDVVMTVDPQVVPPVLVEEDHHDEENGEGQVCKLHRLMEILSLKLDESKEGMQSFLDCLKTHWARSDEFFCQIQNRVRANMPTTSDVSAFLESRVTIIVVVLAAIAVGHKVLWAAKKSHPSPTADLKAFVHHEKVHNHLSSMSAAALHLENLPTEKFQTYARASCVEAATVDQARAALLAGLYGIPDTVRHDVVRMAILEGVTSKNSMQDSHADIVEQGTADSFMAFWSTVYNPDAFQKHKTYSTCAMVTGVTLLVAEQVAEWNVMHEQYQIGVEPCHCGVLYCEECPVFDTRVVRTPVLERHSLSLKKQAELRQWMVYQAIHAAEHLLVEGGGNDYQIGGDYDDYGNDEVNETDRAENNFKNTKLGWDPMSPYGWTRPGGFGNTDKHTIYEKL